MHSPLRLAVLLLLLANVVFFAWSRYWKEAVARSPDTHLLQQQINRDAIRLLPSVRVAMLRSQSGCVEWAGLSGPAVAQAEEALKRQLPGVKFDQRQVSENAAYWVYLPPQPTRQGAQLKTAELRSLGVEDFFVVQDDPQYRFAVSLGVFRTEEAARKRLDQLRAQGVRTALVAPRTSEVPQTAIQLRELPDSANPRLAELLQEFPGSEFRACAERAS